MSVRTDTINLIVNINGNEGQNQLNELRKRAADVKLEMEGMTMATEAYIKKKQELIAVAATMEELRSKAAGIKEEMKDLKKGTDAYTAKKAELKAISEEMANQRNRVKEIKTEMAGLKRGTEEFTAKKAELANITSQMAALKKEMGITALSQKELNSELSKLKALKGSVQPFTDEFKSLDKQIKAVENRLYDVKNGVTGFASTFSKIKDEVKQFGVMAAGYLGFQFITSQFQSIISGAGKLSDSLADIQRVTGMTAEETKALNKQLTELDTRTSTGGLRDIAVVAGKLGVAKDDIFGFTKAVDMLVVSLGDELGDADQITTQLGKILNVFDGKINEENITKLGNAFIELANTGSATGGFIADFDQRLSGIAKSSGISLGALSGLGAGLEEMGAKVESSSTAIQKLIISIAADIPAATKIANISIEDLAKLGVKSFDELFKKDPTEALLRYSEGLVKNKTSFSEVTASLKDAGEEGARTIETITKLGSSAEQLRGRIKLGTDAIQENSAITEAFDLKNQTLGATLDKLGKDFNRLVTSSSVTNFLKGAISGVSDFIKWLKDLPRWLDANRTALILLTGVVLAYVTAKTGATRAAVLNRLATILETGADRLAALQKAVNTGLTYAYAVAKGVLTGKISIATVAQHLWNAAMKANPLGVIIVLISAVAAGISFLVKKYTELTGVQKLQADIQRKAAESTADEEARIRTLTMVIGNSTISLESRKKALQDLIAINPDYLKGLTLENIKTQEGTNILSKYVQMLREKAFVQAATDSQGDKLKEDIKLKQIQYDLEKKIANGRTDLNDLSEEEQGFVGDTRKSFNFTASVTDLATGDNAAKEALQAIKARRAGIQVELDVTDDMIAKHYAAAVGNVAAGSGASADAAGKRVVKTIKSIQDAIKALDDSYVTIDVTNVAALKKNRDERKKLQAELDALEGKETKKTKSEKKADSEYERLKKEAAQFAKDVKKLREGVERGEVDADSAEVLRVQQKYQELQDRAQKYFAKNITSKKEHDAQALDLEALYVREMETLFNKRFEKTAAKEYDASLKAAADYFEGERNLAGRNYAAGLTDKNEYTDKLKQLDSDESAARVRISEDYSATVKKAASDVTVYKNQQEHLVTQTAIAEAEKRKEIADQEKLAKAKLAVLVTRVGSDGRLEAEKKYLQAEFEVKTAGWNKQTEAYKLALKERELAEKDLDKAKMIAEIEKWQQRIGFVQDAMGSINQIVTNVENRGLQRDRKINDEKKKNLKHQLDGKLISQAQYDLKVQAIEEEQKRREGEARIKQAKREKAMAIFSALINTAAAIAKTFVEFGWPLGIPMAAAMAVTGGLQVAAIASQPLPEMGKGDWVRSGDKHNNASGGIPAMIERDEAVMNAASMTNPEVYSVSGTTAQITSALNSMKGGVDWAGGAMVKKMQLDRPAQINAGIPRIMEQGGVVRPIDGKLATSDNSEETNNLLRQVIAKHDQSIEEIKNMKTKLHAVVSIKEYRETEVLYDDAKKVSGIRQ